MGNMSGKLLPDPFRRLMLLMKNHLAVFSLQFSLSNPLVGELPYMSRAFLLTPQDLSILVYSDLVKQNESS